MPTQCLNANTSDLYTFACPFHGWEAIQDYIYTTINSVDSETLALFGGVASPNWVEVTGQGSQRRLMMSDFQFSPEGYDPQPIAATTQQLVVADALTKLAKLWTFDVSNITRIGHGNDGGLAQDVVLAINSDYYQPYTMSSCANDVIQGPQDDSAVAFPLPPGVDPSLMLNQAEYNNSTLDVYSFVYSGITRNEILDTPGSFTESRLKWVELPQDPFNGSAIGAVVLLPRSTDNLTQEIVVCTLGAGWGASLVNTSTFGGGTNFMTSVVDLSIPAEETYVNNSSPYNVAASQAESARFDSVIAYCPPSFPEKPVIITEAWATYLNPFVPALNTTVIDALMSTTQPVEELTPLQQTAHAKWALAGLLANGLASIGATGTLQGTVKTVVKPDGTTKWDGDYWLSGKGDFFIVDPEESKDWVKLRVDTTEEGYAYNIRGTSPKIAIAFLLVYCIIALGHVLYAAISGKSTFRIFKNYVLIIGRLGISSTCWDSIGEVTALAMNSTPTTLLKNTCAGIMELNIFKLPVRVLAVRDDEGDGEHLELVFGNVDEKNIKGTPIKPNRVYGTLPKMAKVEKNE